MSVSAVVIVCLETASDVLAFPFNEAAELVSLTAQMTSRWPRRLMVRPDVILPVGKTAPGRPIGTCPDN